MPSSNELVERLVQARAARGTLLFSGPAGSGKNSSALALVKTVFNESNLDNHPDLHQIHPESKSGLHSLAAIRQLISEVGFPPFKAPCKVFIIHHAERMLPSGSNALLKTLEEPHPDTLIILISEESDQLLPTILSRCRTIPFFAPLKQTSHPLLVTLLSERHDHTSLLKALATFESEEDPPETDSLFDQILYWYRDRHILAENMPKDFLFHKDLLTMLEKARSLPLPPLKEILSLLAECRLAAQRHMKLKTILEYLFLNVLV